MESIGRKKNILGSFSNKRFKNSFNGESNMGDDATSSQMFHYFLDAKKLSVAKMIMDGINEKLAELTKECLIPVTGETETIKSETANFVLEDQTYNMFVDQNTNENVFKIKKQDEDLEQKDVEYAENVELESDKGIDKVFESCGNKNESQDDNEKAAGDVDINVNTVETTQDVDHEVTAASSKFQTQDTEAMEKRFCERTSMDQTASDQDEYEVTDVEESNKQKNIVRNDLENLGSENNGNTNVIKDSQASQYRDNKDETEEPGPIKMSSHDHFRRIYEEMAAKERERVKNKLAIEKAVSEARARASAEDRERAERQRAAVKEAIEEARQRKIVEACETVVKSKRKAQRAAVERATSEVRQRALEKAMYQKTGPDLSISRLALRTKAKLDTT